MSPPTATLTKPSTPLPWLSGPAPTDASFLSRPKSGSVAGCSVGLGDPPTYLLNSPPESHRQSQRSKQTLVRASRLLQSNLFCALPTSLTHNAPLHAFCQLILVVVASVAETEYSAAFGGGQVLVELTLTLTNLGHPQQTHPLLFVDNECAIGLATSSVRQKKFKSIDASRLAYLRRGPANNSSALSLYLLVSLTLLTSLPKSSPSILRHIAALPFLHGTPYPLQSPRCSPRQEQSCFSLPLTSPHFYLHFLLCLCASQHAFAMPLFFTHP
jgi:hypothetical protein